jgi:uncharacterized protein
MVIDVRKLKYSGKDECSFHFDYEADSSTITLPNAEYSGTVSVNGTLTLGGKSVFVDGEIEYSLSAQCSRCLTGVIFHNIVEFDEEFSETEDVEDVYKFKKGLVDLTEMINEKILLSMPYSVLCEDDCKGLCPECGANLNQTKCEHVK